MTQIITMPKATKKERKGTKKERSGRMFEVTAYRLPLCFEVQADSKDEALIKAYEENLKEMEMLDEVSNITVIEKL